MVLNEINTNCKKKIMKKNISILILVCTLGLLWSCKKDLKLASPVSGTDGFAFLKIIDASPNFRQIFKGSDSFNVYVNGVKINGSQLTYNSIFPSTTNLYAAVPAGPQSIRISVNGKINPDSITLASFNKTLTPDSYYSFILTDEAMTANESRQMFIQDKFALTDTSSYTLRFVNAVLNDPTGVDVYSFRSSSIIFTNISPATATNFIKLPYSLLTDTLSVRPTGTQTEITRINISNGGTNDFRRGRPYTILYKGQFGITGTKGRSLTLYAND